MDGPLHLFKDLQICVADIICSSLHFTDCVSWEAATSGSAPTNAWDPLQGEEENPPYIARSGW